MKHTKDSHSRGLIRTAHGSCPSNDDEQVEEDAERGNTKDDRHDSCVDLPKVVGEGTAEEQERSL